MFGNKKSPENVGGKSEYAQKIMEMLGCQCKYFPKGTNNEVIMSAYNEAFAWREMDGCTPMIIVTDEMILENLEQYGNLKENREKMLAAPRIDAQKWFTEKLTEWKNDMGDSWNDVVGAVTDDPQNAVKGFSGFVDYSTKKSEECILAKIPVTNPWEVFAWLPFGGWNECPMPEEVMWISKYWFEKYGAIPAVMTRDILEFAACLVKDKTAAMDLALEQFAFCSDIVFQGVDTIGRLADSLTKSSVWYFWWD